MLHATRTLHPPGGATALIAVIGGETIHRLGFLYALVPAGPGALIMLGGRRAGQQYSREKALPGIPGVRGVFFPVRPAPGRIDARVAVESCSMHQRRPGHRCPETFLCWIAE